MSLNVVFFTLLVLGVAVVSTASVWGSGAALLAIAAGVLLIVAVLVSFAYAARKAPEGWEDERGFHYGRKP